MKYLFVSLILLNLNLITAQNNKASLSEIERLEIKAAELEFQKLGIQEKILEESEKLEFQRSELTTTQQVLEELLKENPKTQLPDSDNADIHVDDYETEELPVKVELIDEEYYDNQSVNDEFRSVFGVKNIVFKKNKVISSAAFGFISNAQGDKNINSDIFEIPEIMYELETYISSNVRFKINSSMAAKFKKSEYEKKIPDGMDCYEEFYQLYFEPDLKVFLLDNYFAGISTPYRYIYVSPQVEDAEYNYYTTAELKFTLGYDSRVTDISLISPWSRFESGWFGGAEFHSYENLINDGLNHEFSLKLSKAMIFQEKFLMLRPYISLSSETKNTYDPLWFDAGIFAAWDFVLNINLNGFINVSYGQLDRNNNADLWGTETFFKAGAELNYYFSESLGIFSCYRIEKLLFAEEGVQVDDPEIFLKIGLKYTVGFIK